MQTNVVCTFKRRILQPNDHLTDCGDVLESNSQPITDCSLLPLEGDAGTLMPCKGNAEEFCGGPDIIAIYTLPGTGLVPMIPFNPVYDSWCTTGDCVGST